MFAIDLEFPDICANCPFFDPHDLYCDLPLKLLPLDSMVDPLKKPNWCPLREVKTLRIVNELPLYLGLKEAEELSLSKAVQQAAESLKKNSLLNNDDTCYMHEQRFARPMDLSSIYSHSEVLQKYSLNVVVPKEVPKGEDPNAYDTAEDD